MADKEEMDPDSTNVDTKTGEAETSDTANEDVSQSLEPVTPEVTNVSSNTEAPQSSDKEMKITLLLKATGNAPIMSKKKWVVPHDKTIGGISRFMRTYMQRNLGEGEKLVLYINQTFSPTNDQTVKNLYDCYGADGKLIIHYSLGQAWG